MFRAVLNEAILRRQVGSTAVMATQLGKLIECARLPNVSIRVSSFSTGMHWGALSGPFMLLAFPPGRDGTPEPPVVCVDDMLGASYLHEEKLTVRYAAAYNEIWAAALSERASVTLMAEAMKEWK